MFLKRSTSFLFGSILCAALCSGNVAAMQESSSNVSTPTLSGNTESKGSYISLNTLFTEGLSEELNEAIIATGRAIQATTDPQKRVVLEQELNKTVKKSLENGADVNWCDRMQWNPIHCAAQYGLTSTLALLLKPKFKPIKDINAFTHPFGTTALNLAAGEGYLDCVKLLVEAGANVNLSDSSNRTACQDAIEGNHPEVVTYLIAQGASPSLKDAGGHTVDVPNVKVKKAIQDGIKKSTLRSNWDRVAFLMIFMRANSNSAIKGSGLALVGEVGKFANLGTKEERYERSLHGH